MLDIVLLIQRGALLCLNCLSFFNDDPSMALLLSPMSQILVSLCKVVVLSVTYTTAMSMLMGTL